MVNCDEKSPLVLSLNFEAWRNLKICTFNVFKKVHDNAIVICYQEVYNIPWQ